MNHTSASGQSLIVVGSYADVTQPSIHTFLLDNASGTLAARGSHTGIGNPSFLIVHPRRRSLYAVSETNQLGSVWALRLDHEQPVIRPINQQPSGGGGPCHLQLDSAGNWLLVSNYGSGTIAVLPLLPDGSLGEMTDMVQHHGQSVHPQRQTEPHTHSSTFAPDNRFAIVADLGIDQLLVYAFDSAAGKLRPHSQTRARPGAGPRHMAFHPTGNSVFVANELDSTVSVYDYDTSSGMLRERQTIDTLSTDAAENTVAHIHVSSSGQRVYVSNRGHNSIATFAIEADGRLDRIAVTSCGGNWPRHFALAPGGSFMLVANQHSDEVSVLPLLVGSEAIGAPIASVGILQASCVQFVETYE